MDVGRARSLASPWSVVLERHDVGLLSERRRLPRQAVDGHVLVATLELTPAGGRGIEAVGHARIDRPCDRDGRLLDDRDAPAGSPVGISPDLIPRRFR